MHELTYVTYLTISVTLTIWVASTLSKNGLAFLTRAFDDDEVLANAVNHMLVVGFYLVNLGYIFLAMNTANTMLSARDMMEFISSRVGLVMLALGFMHFANVYVISRYGRSIADKIAGREEIQKPAGHESTSDEFWGAQR